MNKVTQWLCGNLLRIGSTILAVYFFYIFHSMIGFPPKQPLNPTSTTYLVLSIFFFLIPIAQKLKLGKLLEYEAKVDEIKDEVKDFKEETRQIISMQNTLINTVSNTMNQNINITLPGKDEIQEAKEELNKAIKDSPPQDRLNEEIEDYLASEGSDIHFALAKLRMDIERELRRILEKRLSTQDQTSMKSKFLSARSLFREFIKQYPNYEGMHGSFDYILKICNAAIHGQNIFEGYAQEAFYMGLKMLDALKRVNSNEL